MPFYSRFECLQRNWKMLSEINAVSPIHKNQEIIFPYTANKNFIYFVLFFFGSLLDVFSFMARIFSRIQITPLFALAKGMRSHWQIDYVKNRFNVSFLLLLHPGSLSELQQRGAPEFENFCHVLL